MSYVTFKRTSVLVIAILLALLGWLPDRAQAQSKVADPQNELDQQFQKARDNFLKRDFKDAAAEIRKAEAFIKREPEQATGEDKHAL